jgi:hypothetical protein
MTKGELIGRSGKPLTSGGRKHIIRMAHKTCVWTQSEYSAYWTSACDPEWRTMDGGIREVCHKCNKVIRRVWFKKATPEPRIKMTTQPRLTRRTLLKVMVELLKSRKPASASHLDGYESALKDLSDAFKLNMKDMGGK